MCCGARVLYSGVYIYIPYIYIHIYIYLNPLEPTFLSGPYKFQITDKKVGFGRLRYIYIDSWQVVVVVIMVILVVQQQKH